MISTTLARVKRNLESADVSFAAFAKLTNTPESSLRLAMQGKQYLGAVKEAEMLTISVRLAEICEALKPLACERGATEPLKILLGKTPEEIRRTVSTIFAGE